MTVTWGPVPQVDTQPGAPARLASASRVRWAAPAAPAAPQGWRFAVELAARATTAHARRVGTTVPACDVLDLPGGQHGWVLHRGTWRQETWPVGTAPAPGAEGDVPVVAETTTELVLTRGAALVVLERTRTAGEDPLVLVRPATDPDLRRLDTPHVRREHRYRTGRRWHVEVTDAPDPGARPGEPGSGVLARLAALRAGA